MKIKLLAGAAALTSVVLISAAPAFACTWPYVPKQHSSGNTVCVHNAVVNGPQNLAAPTTNPPPYAVQQLKTKKRLLRRRSN